MKSSLSFLAVLVLLTSLAQAAERRPADRAARPRSAAGLGFRVDAEPSALTLRRPKDVLAHLMTLPGIYTGATDPVLTVALGEPAAERGPSSWVQQTILYKTSAATARAVVSRLSPAVLLESPENSLRLQPAQAAAPSGARDRGASPGKQADGKLPRYLAWVEAGRPVIRPAAELAQPTPLRIDEPWILLWFGADTAVGGHAGMWDIDSRAGPSKVAMAETVPDRLDVPLLLRLEHRPSAVRLLRGQIVFEFPQAVGKAAIMPVFGRRIWLSEETEAWKAGLPEAVLQQCRLWSRWLRDYPLSVEETYQVEQAGDVLSVRQAFTWASFEDDWHTPPVKAAPIPPMLSVALGSGVAVSFAANGKRVDPVEGNWMDQAGKMMAVESAEGYEYRLTGLQKLLGTPAKSTAVADEAKPLRARLERHVAEMTAAGHLRPLFLMHGGVGSWNVNWYGVGTPEMAYALARAYPYLSTELQAKVRQYVQSEWQQFPPLELDRRYYSEGAPREPYGLEGVEDRSSVARNRDEAYRRRNFFLDLYRIEAAARVIPGVPDAAPLRKRAAELAAELAERQDWAILGPTRLRELSSAHEARFTTLQGSAAYNSWLGGAIGLARLAEKHGWQEEGRLACYLAGKLALARVAQARYVEEMHRMGLVRGKVEDDYRAISHVDERCTVVRWGPLTTVVAEDQELPPFIDLVPEVGRLLADYARPQCAVYLNYLDYAVPYWYLSEAPKQSASEHHLCPLWHQSGNVPAQAWILGKSGKEFTRYVDVTRFRGDLFAIQNLVTAIEACRPR